MKKISLDGLLKSIEEDSSVRRLIQSSPVCHKIFDPEFKLRFMSRSGVDALQIESIENIYGHAFPTDSAPKITRDIFKKHLSLAAKGEKSTIEYSFDVDGNTIWFRTTLSPFWDTDGALIYITADSMNISDRIKADINLKEAHDRLEVRVEERTKKLQESNDKLKVEIHERKLSEDYLSIIANNTTSVIYMKNLEGRYLFINKQWENIFNVTSQEVRGKTDLNLFPKEIAEKFIKNDQKVMQSGKTFEGEEFAPHDDGLHTYISIKVPLKDSKGVTNGMCGVSTDITDKKISENLTTRLGRILDNSFNEIYLFNAENLKFIQANLGAYNNLNYSHEEMLRLTPLDLKPEFTKETFEEMIRPLRSKEKSLVVFETLHKRKDGTIYPVEIRLQLMTNETPQVFIAVVQDITQRKQAEEKIKIYYSELEKANEELQSFSAIASHDLQEPLRKITTFGDRLATRIPETDEQGKDYLNRMQKSTLRMRKLVEDLLQYTQVTSNPRPFESLNLNKVVETVLDDLETRISETQGAVNFSNLPVIEGDSVQLHQLFLNLIGNALKFHRDGIPPVVNLESAKTENGFWEITVEDNGIGIEKEHVGKIFKPFERLHGKTTYEGTGIGLTICNKIVSRHGGKITVKRQSTNGVTFHITLPEKPNNGEVV